MNKTSEQLSAKGELHDPIVITHPEPWQWEVLAKGFLPDPVLNFWLGEKTDLTLLENFFEAVVKDTLISGGGVFASPDHKVVIVWTWHGGEANEWKKKWKEILGPEGVKRYNSVYNDGDVLLDSDTKKNSMLPDYISVLPEAQGQGYGTHILKWTLNHYDELGFETPHILASTRRSAKLYAAMWGFHNHKVVQIVEGDEDAAIFMKRDERTQKRS